MEFSLEGTKLSATPKALIPDFMELSVIRAKAQLQTFNVCQGPGGVPKIQRLKAGESLPRDLLRVAVASGLQSAKFEGIGGLDELLLGYYNQSTKKYEEHRFTEFLEVTSLIGNLTLKEGSPFLHMHGNFGRRDLSVIGGHVISARVHPTLEVVFTPLEGRPMRELDDESGLFLLKG